MKIYQPLKNQTFSFPNVIAALTVPKSPINTKSPKCVNKRLGTASVPAEKAMGSSADMKLKLMGT